MNQAVAKLSLRQIFTPIIGAPLLLVVMMAMMVLPLPPFFLDIFFSFNIAFSIVVVMAVVYSNRPLEFAIFPTILLVATLLRLALNIASTRVVLLNGHTGTGAAGQVIEAFGDVVIGGNYAVGLVVFAILIVINFVVVTKGAGRISEVSARFTLDAMPGKQMAIDADLNAGLISQEDAKKRREEVSEEADFYGAMDGASKFVRGDAIAGILILVINIVGGLSIGLLQHDLTFNTALENYSLLTIGDGLVAQIPSLFLSTAAAVMVTRVSKAHDMGQQVSTQLFGNSKIFNVAAGVLIAFGIVPGMPIIPFSILGLALFYIGHLINQKKAQDQLKQAKAVEQKEPKEVQKDLSWEDVSPVDIIGLEVGYRLISLVDSAQGGELMGKIKGIRKKLTGDLGFLIPAVHIRDNLNLNPNAYSISLMGVTISQYEVFPDKMLAINPGSVFGELEGVKTNEPSFGLDALWIDIGEKEKAQSLGYTVVDPSTVIATHLSHIINTHAHELLGHEEVQKLLEMLAKSSPKLVEDLVPEKISIASIVKILQNLLQEHIPIKDIRSILQCIAEHVGITQDPEILTSMVRVSLRRLIIQTIYQQASELPVITLDHELEQILLKSIQGSSALAIEPSLAQRIQSALVEQVKEREFNDEPPVLLVHPSLRSMLSRFTRAAVRGLYVISHQEVPDDKNIKIVANIK